MINRVVVGLVFLLLIFVSVGFVIGQDSSENSLEDIEDVVLEVSEPVVEKNEKAEAFEDSVVEKVEVNEIEKSDDVPFEDESEEIVEEVEVNDEDGSSNGENGEIYANKAITPRDKHAMMGYPERRGEKENVKNEVTASDGKEKPAVSAVSAGSGGEVFSSKSILEKRKAENAVDIKKFDFTGVIEVYTNGQLEERRFYAEGLLLESIEFEIELPSPFIEVVRPVNEEEIGSKIFDVEFTVNHEKGIRSCYIEAVSEYSKLRFKKGWISLSEVNSMRIVLAYGEYDLSVSCEDKSGVVGKSGEVNVNIIDPMVNNGRDSVLVDVISPRDGDVYIGPEENVDFSFRVESGNSAVRFCALLLNGETYVYPERVISSNNGEFLTLSDAQKEFNLMSKLLGSGTYEGNFLCVNSGGVSGESDDFVFVINGGPEEAVLEEPVEDLSGGDGGCSTIWVSGEWGECIEGIQERSVIKERTSCWANPNEKPAETRECVAGVSEEGTGFFSTITGAVIGPNGELTNLGKTVLVFFLVLIVGSVIVYRRRHAR